ncbi:helix-turn-helix domain-containing protein [Simiduia curdlanivorans]|uniref:Helix-turn-helix domain-containing protein n=1 Tax=Simiduia curdlanivorans TaxID=1492769 RepID=A0ABV8V618_9GAMM|nr:AraC family transcriptional regulator [Simiduia curdlanivorans]MDN3638705.1 helix-turn-helix domain-containing protein [Simiduia curdlanivorans]
MTAFISHYSLAPVNMLQLIAAFTLLFATALLWHKPRFRGFSLLLVLEAILMLFNFSEETGMWRQHYLITPVFSLCTGPAFYLFIQHLVFNQPWQVRALWHFAPAFLALPFTAYTQSVLALGSISLLAYGIAAYLLLVRYHRGVQGMESDTGAVQLSWLIKIMLAFALLGINDIVRLNSQPFVDYAARNMWYLLHLTGVFATFVAAIFLALRQPALFDQLGYFEACVQSPTLDENDCALEKQLFEQIDQVVKQQALFKTPRLSLQNVSDSTGLLVRDVSSAINKGSGHSFSDYINGLRVDYVKTTLNQTPDRRGNLLTLALASGFNSKTAFNNAFKQHSGLTPSQYLQRLSKPPA